MGRRTREKVLRIRYRDVDDHRNVKSRLVINSNHRSAGRLFSVGKVLKISKMSEEEKNKTGEFFPARELLKELRASH